jgi:WD40 repeat protein
MIAIRRAPLIVLLATISGCSGSHSRGVEPIVSFEVAGKVSAIQSIEFSPKGSTLAVAVVGSDQGQRFKSVILYETGSFKAVRTIPVPERPEVISFSPDGKTLAVGTGDYQGLGSAYLFDSATGKQIARFGGTSGWVHDLGFSPDGKLLASCGSTWDLKVGQGYHDGKATVWELASGNKRPVLESESKTYRSGSFSPNGQSFVVGGGTSHMNRSDSGNVSLCDVTTGRVLWNQASHSMVVESVAFSPDGKTIAAGGMDGVLKLLDAANGKSWFVSKRLSGQYGRVLSLAFSPDGKYLTAALGSFNRGGKWGELRAWEIQGRVARELLIFEGESPMTSVAFSPDGRFLASGDFQGVLRVWESAKVFVAIAKE